MKRILFAALAALGLLTTLSAPATAAKAPPAVTITPSAVLYESELEEKVCLISWSWVASQPSEVESYNIRGPVGAKERGRIEADSSNLITTTYSDDLPYHGGAGWDFYFYVQVNYLDGGTSKWVSYTLNDLDC